MNGKARVRGQPAELMKKADEALQGRRRSIVARLRWLVLAAAAGDPVAQADLGLWYLDGYTTRSGRHVLPRSPKRAVSWLRLAALAGVTSAQVALGNCYYDGIGIAKDERAAQLWYRRAASNGDGAGALNLSTVYRDRNNVRAERKWLTKAKELGDPEAEPRLRRLEHQSRR